MRDAKAERRRPQNGPVSVALPGELKRRIAREAARRELKLSTAMRVLLSERVQEIEESEQLSRAEEYQRTEAWATWDRLKAGHRTEVSRADLDKVFAAADRLLRPRR